MGEVFDEIYAVYLAIGSDLFGRVDLHDALRLRDPDEAAFFALVLVGSEIDNGGFAQLFTNSTADIFLDAVEGADRFGLRDHVRLLGDAGSEFFPDGVPLDQSTRLEMWRAMPDDPYVDVRLRRLDKRWYALDKLLRRDCIRTPGRGWKTIRRLSRTLASSSRSGVILSGSGRSAAGRTFRLSKRSVSYSRRRAS
jgi:hypothetical protein